MMAGVLPAGCWADCRRRLFDSWRCPAHGVLIQVLLGMLILTQRGHYGLHKLISNCRYVFPGNRAEVTETLTFVYALPPLSSCRENRKRAMKPADPTLYYRGASITGS